MSDELDGRGARSAVKDAMKREPVDVGAAARQMPLPMLVEDAGPREAAEGDDGEKRGPGRPAGSRNRRQQAWADWLLSQYRSPLQALAEAANRPLGELLAEIKRICEVNHIPLKADGGFVLELLKFQLRAAVELAPYIHQKQPQAVDLGDGQGLVHLSFNLAPEAADVARRHGVPVEGAPDTVTLQLAPLEDEGQRNQALSASAETVRHGAVSDNDAQTAENSDK